MSFPFREYKNDELLKEFTKLKNKEPSLQSKIGYKCSNCFFQYERFNTSTHKHKSCLEYWNNPKKREYVLKYNKTSKKDLFGDIQFLYHPPSQFSPIIAKYIYTFFKAKSVFDPFAGWGDRCLAAMSLDIDYFGTDTNTRLRKPYKKMVNFYSKKSNSNVTIKYISCIKIDIENLNFDFVFTSPPFFEKKKSIENYHNFKDSYEYFLQYILVQIKLDLQRAYAPNACRSIMACKVPDR